jgi:menaquinone-9 beta-reductase
MKCDVVVVGGGPAGSVTGLLLARAGFDVIVVERSTFPRSKPCGDCLSPAANTILQRLGLWDDIVATQPALLAGWQLTSHGQRSFAARFNAVTCDPGSQCALAIERSIFDAVLLHAAQSAGVRVLYNARVTDVVRASGLVRGVTASVDGAAVTIHADLSVGADGLRSIVARRLDAYARAPRLRKASFTMHFDMQRSSDLGEMRLSDDACLGIAPVSAITPRHNMTLVLKRGSYDKHGGVREIVRAGLARFGIIMDDAARGEILTSGPFDWPVRHVAFAGGALVGDAAGYYDPFTGQGIYQALAGAERLAQFAVASLRDRRTADFANCGYAEALRQITSPARRVQRMIEFVCARPRLSNYAFARLGRDQVLASALVGVTGDLAPPNSVFSPRMLLRLAT